MNSWKILGYREVKPQERQIIGNIFKKDNKTSNDSKLCNILRMESNEKFEHVYIRGQNDDRECFVN